VAVDKSSRAILGAALRLLKLIKLISIRGQRALSKKRKSNISSLSADRDNKRARAIIVN